MVKHPLLQKEKLQVEASPLGYDWKTKVKGSKMRKLAGLFRCYVQHMMGLCIAYMAIRLRVFYILYR